MTVDFQPRLALASLSGEADAAWAAVGSEYAGAAFLGGIALDGPTREAARELVERDRTEFLPPDPFVFVDVQLAALDPIAVRPGFNVRASSAPPIREAARICASHDAVIEINAHCRQDEMCRAGAGQSLLHDPARLCAQIRAASETGATVSVKIRTEVDGVDLPAVAGRAVEAGADMLHVDAMDSESMVADIVEAVDSSNGAPAPFVIANNGVRDRETVREYLDYGADAVSVGRPSDDPAVLDRVRRAVDDYFAAVGGSI